MRFALPRFPRPEEITDEGTRRRRRWRERLDEARAHLDAARERLVEQASDLPDIARLEDAARAPEIQLPDIRLPDRADLPRLPEASDLRRLAGRVKLPKMPSLPAMPELSGVPRRLGLRTRRESQRTGWLAVAGRVVLVAGAAILGAMTVYLFDPDRGRGRRAQALDRASGLARRASRRAGRVARYGMSTAAAMGERMTRQTRWYVPPNDATLQAKVESELFRDPSIPKGRMNLNVENRVVILRGVGDTPEQIERIVAATRAVAGVRDVHSLLHLADAPAPDEMVGPGLTSS
jgi:osmotically-inducible protein OsmY